MKLIVGFSHGNKFLSKIISELTDSNISHCYLRAPVNGVDMVFQASGLSVNIESWEIFQLQHEIVEEYETELEADIIIPLMLAEMGKPYAMKALFGYLWVIFCQQLGFTVTNPFFDGNQAYVCSEFVCKMIGVNDALENITPEDLRKLCAIAYKRIT